MMRDRCVIRKVAGCFALFSVQSDAVVRWRAHPHVLFRVENNNLCFTIIFMIASVNTSSAASSWSLFMPSS